LFTDAAALHIVEPPGRTGGFFSEGKMAMSVKNLPTNRFQHFLRCFGISLMSLPLLSPDFLDALPLHLPAGLNTHFSESSSSLKSFQQHHR
jgi:hypothetical protein